MEDEEVWKVRTEADPASFTFSGVLSCSTGLIHACDGVMKSLRSVSVCVGCCGLRGGSCSADHLPEHQRTPSTFESKNGESLPKISKRLIRLVDTDW